MRTIGTLVLSEAGDYSHLSGSFATLQIALNIEIEQLPERRSPKHPSHAVTAKAPNGQKVQIGSAWLNTAKATHSKGKKFLSITLDDPCLDDPIYLTAFPNDDLTEMDIVASRKRGDLKAI